MKTTDAAKLMGRKILVTKELRRERVDGLRRWVAYDREPRAGWFTGIRWLQTGIVEGGHYYGEGDYDPAYLKETEKRTVCALVVFWPNENAKRVPLDGFRDWVEGNPEAFSTSGFGEHHRDKYIEDLRNIMKEEHKRQERDAKGRFVR